MPTQLSNPPFARKMKSQPNLLLASSLSREPDLNIRKNELFSPTYANSNVNPTGRKNGNQTKTDFFSATNLSKLNDHTRNEYNRFETSRVENKHPTSANKGYRGEYGNSGSSVRYRINAQNSRSQHNDVRAQFNTPDQQDVSAYKRREQELLSEINNLNINLRQYKELNDELTDKLKRLKDQHIRRYSFQDSSIRLGKKTGNSDNTYFMEKYHETEKANDQLKSEISNLKRNLKELQDSSGSTYNTDNKEDTIKDLVDKNNDLKRKLRTLHKAYETEKMNSHYNYEDKYKELYNQECDKNATLKKEIDKLRHQIDTDNHNHNKIIEELNTIKVKNLSEANNISKLKEQLDYESRQAKQLRNSNQHLRKILRIHGYDHEIPIQTNSSQNMKRTDLYAPTQVHNNHNDKSRTSFNEYSEKSRTRKSEKMPLNKSIKGSEYYTSPEKPKVETPVKHPSKPVMLNIEVDSIQSETFRPKMLKSSSLSGTDNFINRNDSKARQNSIEISIIESRGSFIDSPQRRTESMIDESHLYMNDSLVNKKNNNAHTIYKDSHIDEYGAKDSQLRNIFKTPFLASKVDNNYNSEIRSKAHSAQQFNFEQIDNGIDSFGIGNVRNGRASLNSRIKRI